MADEKPPQDSWIRANLIGPRQVAYQLGRLFNRFCFHIDQAYVAHFQLRDASVFQHRLAVQALRDIERQAQLLDLGNPGPVNSIREQIEAFTTELDSPEYAERYAELMERCSSFESDPSVQDLLRLGANGYKATVRSILLGLVGESASNCFSLGYAVDQAVRPDSVATLVAQLREEAGAGKSDRHVSGFGAGEVPAESDWDQPVRSLLIQTGTPDALVTSANSLGGRQLFDLIEQLDVAIRTAFAVTSAPQSAQRSSRLVIDRSTDRALLDGTWYVLAESAATLLAAMLDADGDWVTGSQIAKELGIEEFKVTRAKQGLPEPIRALIESNPGKGNRLIRETWLS